MCKVLRILQSTARCFGIVLGQCKIGFIMKGFEICINDAAPIVAMTDSLVTLIISVGYG